MTREKFYATLSARIPATLSEEWDNDGEMCVPSPTRQVERVLCTLDVCDEVVDRAINEGYDLILSHHPLIFRGVSALNTHDPVAKRLIRLVQNDIAVFSFHTRLDAVEGGINDALLEMLGITEGVSSLEGMGRIGELPSPLRFEEFANRVKIVLDAVAVNALCVKETVSCVAVVGGEGKDFIDAAVAAGADTYLSGRLGYHAMLDGEINLIECGHYFSEKHAARLLAKMAKRIDETVETAVFTPNLLGLY